MKIAVPYKYTEQEIPKHCRKPRSVQHEGVISLSIHEVIGPEAPVAIREHTKQWDERTGSYGPFTIEYRWWSQRLWILDRFNRYSHGPYEIQIAEQFAKDPWPMANGRDYGWYQSRQKRRAELMRWARSILFIDSVRWKQTQEPRYVIMTFGLGHNHGHPGTSLSSTNSYNPNISRERYFPISYHDLALATAIAIAERRGDDQAIPFIKESHDTFDILIPEAVRLNPHKEHGEGDPFINKLEGMIEQSPNSMVAGLLVINEGMKVVSEIRAGGR